ncbi:hypothetical protein FHR99_003200 [Litorivivens lipolytica]|uniref:Uncharacterized protein n=1 Tax=Litorivivens lipolytica TaxID=1524264 RepID=A0A7W4W7H0_9GAMM|nr:hypothetical protein [Litorivivens lipolytica]
MIMKASEFLRPMVGLYFVGLAVIMAVTVVGYFAFPGVLAKVFISTIGVTLAVLWIPLSGMLVCKRLAQTEA